MWRRVPFLETRRRWTRDRRHQAHGRFIQPLHSPLNLPVWVTWTPPSAPNSTAAHARPHDSRRHPARQTRLTGPVARSRCASGSGCLRSAHRWSARRVLHGLGGPDGVIQGDGERLDEPAMGLMFPIPPRTAAAGRRSRARCGDRTHAEAGPPSGTAGRRGRPRPR